MYNKILKTCIYDKDYANEARCMTYQELITRKVDTVQKRSVIYQGRVVHIPYMYVHDT